MMSNQPQQVILQIEDNPLDIKLIKGMLEKITSFNYKLITAETLKDGCEQIKNNDIILILLDLNLPDSTGKQTFDSIINVAENIPVVLVSGLEDLELSLSLIKEGAQDYITKRALNRSLLEGTIQFAIERKKLFSELNKRTKELKQLNSYFVDRELKMIELKKEINELLKKYGEEEKYKIHR